MIVQRLLVLVDVKLADIASGPERLKDGPMRGTPAFVCYSGQAGLAHRKELFREAMLENSPTRPPRRMGDFVFSATVQLVLLAVLLLLPLYFSEAIDVHQFNRTLLAAPPPAPAPPPPPGPTQFVAMESKVFTADAIQALEQQVNEWLAENPGIEIQFAAQSESKAQPNGWSITFTILYKKIGS